MWFVLALFACTGSEDSDPVDTDPVVDTDVDTDTDEPAGEPVVDVTTSLGAFAIRLDVDEAPVTAGNFLAYVDAGYFDGDDGLGETVFHRVIASFVAQGGGYTPDGAQKATLAPIALESDNGLSNLRGTIAMARTNDPDSATSQFYVNLVDNTFLDYDGPTNPGYAVFGEVIEGMETIDAIGAVATSGSDAPLEDIVITSCERR